MLDHCMPRGIGHTNNDELVSSIMVSLPLRENLATVKHGL